MADNVPITAGSGTTVATDEINTGSGAAHVQLVKLLSGTDGDTARIPGDATNGLDVDVTRLPALAAGTNNIGDVDVLSVVPGTSATSLGKAEDASHSSGDTGVMALGVRNDAGTALAGTDGDYIPLSTDSSGFLRVNVSAGGTSGTQYTEADTDASITGTAAMWEDAADTLRAVSMAKPLPVQPGTSITFPVTDNGGSLTVDGSVAVTNAGTFVVQENGAALTALQLIDDAIFAEDVAAQAADKGVAILAVRRDADTSLVGADNDYANLQVDANGALKVEIFDGGGSHTVDQPTAANLNCTEASAATIATNTGNAATSLSVLDDWDETDRAKVNIIVGQAGVAAGAGAVGATVQRVTLASDDPAVASLSVMDDWDNGASDGASVSGDVAHDAADAGEPVKLGHKAIDLGANPTDVAANDRTNWYSMRNGVPFVIGGAPFVKSQNLQVTDADGAQTDAAILTAAANVAIMVTAIEVTADNANTGDVSVRIGFGTANTPAADADKVIMFHPGIAPGSGVVKGSGAGIIGAGLSGEDLRVTCEDPAGGSVSITVTYFTLAIG